MTPKGKPGWGAGRVGGVFWVQTVRAVKLPRGLPLLRNARRWVMKPTPLSLLRWFQHCQWWGAPPASGRATRFLLSHRHPPPPHPSPQQSVFIATLILKSSTAVLVWSQTQGNKASLLFCYWKKEGIKEDGCRCRISAIWLKFRFGMFSDLQSQSWVFSSWESAAA